MKVEAGAEEGGKKPHVGKRGHRRPGGSPILPSQASHMQPTNHREGPLTRRCTFGSMEPPFPGRHGQGIQGFSLLLKKEEDVIKS